jgi:hypothetical protein
LPGLGLSRSVADYSKGNGFRVCEELIFKEVAESKMDTDEEHVPACATISFQDPKIATLRMHRSVADQGKEYEFRVYKELMFNEVAEPEMGTDEERARVCVPFPFEASISNNEASGDFEIHVEGWRNFAYYSPGRAQLS